MNIVVATPLYPPRSLVGAWIATHRLARGAAAAGHQVTALATSDRARPWTIDGVTVNSALRGRTHLTGMIAAADVVVTHGDWPDHAARDAGRPLVRMAHGHNPGRIDDVDLVVANSTSLATTIDTDAPVIVCHPPVDVDEHRVEPGTGDALTIVNCSAAKGIKTAWRLATAQPHRRFLGIAGGYGHQLEPRATNFTRWPTQRDMRTVWAATRILLMPSAHETWGMVAIEAACCGIPTIAHPTPGLVEALGPAGIFADRDDLDAWTTAIERLDDPDVYATASATALARATELAAEQSTRRFIAALEDLT